MRNIALIGDLSALGSYAEALERAGFFPSLRPPGDDCPLEGDINLVVVDLATVGEDALARDLIANAGGGDSLPVIGIAGPGQIDAFDPVRELDDYVVWGADPADLAVRIRRVLWRRNRVDSRNVLKVGDLIMDLSSYTVEIAGHPVDLTYKEYELLRFLATNRDRVHSREVLLNKVWGYDFYGGARTVDVHIRRLRSKIEDSRRTFIETVRNVGYRFHAG